MRQTLGGCMASNADTRKRGYPGYKGRALMCRRKYLVYGAYNASEYKW